MSGRKFPAQPERLAQDAVFAWAILTLGLIIFATVATILTYHQIPEGASLAAALLVSTLVILAAYFRRFVWTPAHVTRRQPIVFTLKSLAFIGAIMLVSLVSLVVWVARSVGAVSVSVVVLALLSFLVGMVTGIIAARPRIIR